MGSLSKQVNRLLHAAIGVCLLCMSTFVFANVILRYFFNEGLTWAEEHPVLSSPACERLTNSIIKEIVVTNTIPIPPEKCFEKLKVLSVAPLLGEAIIRIYDDLSVSRLFDT